MNTKIICHHGNPAGRCRACELEATIADQERELAKMQRVAERALTTEERAWLRDFRLAVMSGKR